MLAASVSDLERLIADFTAPHSSNERWRPSSNSVYYFTMVRWSKVRGYRLDECPLSGTAASYLLVAVQLM